ncbi:lytic transglycosylase domain-containing protein [Schlegelella sp. S2-27]|uniref:Lytic transglycosylase domain-containing protein n=1 Tax=Caldimonas mangrovi TaxID=2944811 RepID=A0ABT0YRT3_9BURK|nr:lytic transglycosylase domain-containing protein [Caldimonas mangrovi]MCM5681455.1 lytic transglycosylase domain-containing protein [Caldimonas mangrovi]
MEYLCRQRDGSERRVPADEALLSRRAGFACLPVITGRPLSGDADVVTVHVGITEIAAAPGPVLDAIAVPPSLPAPPPSIAESLVQAARRHGLDPSLVVAVMYVESRYRPQARSPKGALGLMQLMPATASQYGVSTEQALLDPHVNIDVGARHLRSLVDRFGDRIDLVLAAYNAGEGAVARHGHRVPPYAETRDYVRKVMALMEAAASGP